MMVVVLMVAASDHCRSLKISPRTTYTFFLAWPDSNSLDLKPLLLLLIISETERITWRSPQKQNNPKKRRSSKRNKSLWIESRATETTEHVVADVDATTAAAVVIPPPQPISEESEVKQCGCTTLNEWVTDWLTYEQIAETGGIFHSLSVIHPPVQVRKKGKFYIVVRDCRASIARDKWRIENLCRV